MKKDDYILLVEKYKRQILQCSALVVVVVYVCGISCMTGQRSGRRKTPAAAGSEGGTEEITSQYTDLPPGSPSFPFPPGVAFRKTTPSNVDIMDSQVLNLAYLYENGVGSAGPADSYTDRPYGMLALKDTSQISGLYDPYNYTPQQLTSLSGLPDTAVTSPSGTIPESRNLSVRFVNSGLQETGSASNARETISTINTLHYCGMLKDMKTMEDYTDELWNAPHKYSVSMGDIYYRGGSCLYETAAGQPAADESGVKGAGEVVAITSASDTSYPEATASDAVLPTNSRTCSDHVDCAVLVVLKGTEEAGNLFQAADSLEAIEAPGWTGWDTHTVNMAGVLLAQDWSQEYGFYTVDYPVRGLLNSREIEQYIGLVPEDASQRRRGFMRYALTPVGKVPYYQGDEPSAPSYTGNSLGSLTVPDEDSRILKGLGCSGWVNWVYWSVTGRGLRAQNTRVLLGSGTPMSRDELLPRDICIRFDPMAHVVIFLGRTVKENMLCIQETAGSSNNVEMGTATSNWENYRCTLE